MLEIQTQGRRMVGADETAELWRPPKNRRKTQAKTVSANKATIIFYIFSRWLREEKQQQQQQQQ